MNFEEKPLNEVEEVKASRTWLLSFIDLLSLLLGFFVLMYSTKDLSTPEFYEVKDSFIRYINGEKPTKEYNFVKKPGNTTIIKGATNLSYIETVLRNSLFDDVSLGINIFNQDNRIVVELNERYVKDEELYLNLTNKLITLSKTLNSLTNQLQIITQTGVSAEEKNINKFVADKIEELGYEQKILRTLPLNNFISENLEKNKKGAKIQIIINNYESVF